MLINQSDTFLSDPEGALNKQNAKWNFLKRI